MSQNYGLGRGLSSLIPQKSKTISQPSDDFNYFGSAPKSPSGEPIGTAAASLKNSGNFENNERGAGVNEISINDIVPNPYQPRTNFDETKLMELAESIKQHGIIQPIVASKNGRQYEIIAGERRFKAAKLAGLRNVPVIIREKPDDQKKLELAVVENVQRQDLDPIEEAKSYRKLSEEFDLSQEEVAKKLGKSRSVVANKLRLLELPIEIQRSLIEGKITEGHAKAILAIKNPEKQRALYELILKDNLTVRQTEGKTREISVKTHKRQIVVDPVVKREEEMIAQALGTKVKIKKSGGGGRIVIDYYSQEELNNILGHFKPIS
jgi:ParB family chromosome partitioning protein